MKVIHPSRPLPPTPFLTAQGTWPSNLLEGQGLRPGPRLALVAVALVVACLPARAGETAQFLKIGVGARAVGMGGAYTAAGDDLNSMAWNPGGMASLTKREAGAMYANLVAETHYSFMGYGQPTKYGTFGAGIMYLGQGSLDGRDSQGRANGGFTASDMALGVSYAKTVLPRLGLGVNVKLVRTNVGSDTGYSVAFDLGSRYDLGRMGPGSLAAGLAVLNLGPGIRLHEQSSDLPLVLATGLGYNLPFGLNFGLDFRNRPYAGSSEVSLGTELAVVPQLALRMGYASTHGLISGAYKTSDLMGLAAGFGVKAYGMSLDYSMTPFGGLGNSHRISLGSRF
ncbi:MAG: PorV/PorQ family protein [Elusimicrobia bacterium]|nr:PorV/PorQ family protein [Elusimicrobiota bacterium]